jgi:hypothetical protein
LPSRLLGTAPDDSSYPVSYSSRLEDLCEETRQRFMKTART